MKNKLLCIILLTLVICGLPYIAFADSISGGTLTLDNSGGNMNAGDLQTRAEAQVGAGNGPSTITELIVTATGAFNSTDITYINSLGNLQILNVSSSIVIGDAGDSFCSSEGTTNFDNLNEVTFPATTYGHSLFRNCNYLTTVNLPNATTFGDRALESCVRLNSLSLPNATTFGDRAFAGAEIMDSFSLPSASSFGDYAFYHCISLTSLSLPSALSFGDYAFRACSTLTSLSLPSASSFGDDTFLACPILTNLTLGSTPPTVSSWGSGLPASRNVNVPDETAVAVYDAASAPDGDGLWEGWILLTVPSSETTVISNPQTGEQSWLEDLGDWFASVFK